MYYFSRKTFSDMNRHHFIILATLCILLGSCAAPKAIDSAEHHHAAIDTLSIQAAVDARMTSWHERMDSLFRERVSQFSAEQHSSTDQKELITETVTTTTDSLGRAVRQEQRTISRDLHQEQQQIARRIEREMESRLQTALALQDSIWQQRLNAAMSHREQTDSTHNTVTPVPQDNRPWYRRWADHLQWLAIGIVLAAAAWITRRWWRRLIK
jgi:apolipoprotein N-acyltransferase